MDRKPDAPEHGREEARKENFIRERREAKMFREKRLPGWRPDREQSPALCPAGGKRTGAGVHRPGPERAALKNPFVQPVRNRILQKLKKSECTFFVLYFCDFLLYNGRRSKGERPKRLLRKVYYEQTRSEASASVQAGG